MKSNSSDPTAAASSLEAEDAKKKRDFSLWMDSDNSSNNNSHRRHSSILQRADGVVHGSRDATSTSLSTPSTGGSQRMTSLNETTTKATVHGPLNPRSERPGETNENRANVHRKKKDPQAAAAAGGLNNHPSERRNDSAAATSNSDLHNSQQQQQQQQQAPLSKVAKLSISEETETTRATTAMDSTQSTCPKIAGAVSLSFSAAATVHEDIEIHRSSKNITSPEHSCECRNSNEEDATTTKTKTTLNQQTANASTTNASRKQQRTVVWDLESALHHIVWSKEGEELEYISYTPPPASAAIHPHNDSDAKNPSPLSLGVINEEEEEIEPKLQSDPNSHNNNNNNKQEWVVFRVGHAGDASALASCYRKSTTLSSYNNNNNNNNNSQSPPKLQPYGTLPVRTERQGKDPSLKATASLFPLDSSHNAPPETSRWKTKRTFSNSSSTDGDSSALEVALADGLGDEDTPPFVFALIADVHSMLSCDNHTTSTHATRKTVTPQQQHEEAESQDDRNCHVKTEKSSGKNQEQQPVISVEPFAAVALLTLAWEEKQPNYCDYPSRSSRKTSSTAAITNVGGGSGTGNSGGNNPHSAVGSADAHRGGFPSSSSSPLQQRVLRVEWYYVNRDLSNWKVLEQHLWLRLSALALLTCCQSILVSSAAAAVAATPPLPQQQEGDTTTPVNTEQP